MIGFLAMAFLVTQNPGVPGIDKVIRDAIIGFRSDGLTSIMQAITYMGNTNTVILWCVILLIFRGTRIKYGLAVSLGASASATVQTIIKHWVQRPRPDIHQFLITQGGYSFPSGHSCTGLMFYGFLIYLINVHMKNKKLARELSLLFSILIFAIGFSRIYLGVH
ncbi:MAG: phosphatase PAP2 family protein, partial [Anaerovorax sp.]